MDKTYPMATIDMIRALLDGYSDVEIAKLIADECDNRARTAYGEARNAASLSSDDERKFGRVVNHNATRLTFWRKHK